MNAVDYIRHWEGFVPRLYLCPAGYPTIGYGTRIATWSLQKLEAETTAAMASYLRTMIERDRGDWITVDQATALMLPAVERAMAVAIQTFSGGTEAGMPRWIALTDLAYNMGSFRAFPRFVEAVKAGDWQEAHDELLYVDTGTIQLARAKLAANGAREPYTIHAGDSLKTAYYCQTGRRAECNAQIILTGEMPEVLP